MKIQRQSIATRRPPTGGPEEAATAAVAAQIPTTSVCWRFGKTGSSSPSEVGTMAAACYAAGRSWAALRQTRTARSGGLASARARVPA